jgi:hypothetical protein
MADKMDTNLKEYIGEMRSWRKETTTCLKKTEATDLEANSEEKESEAVHEEVPEEEAAVETSGARKKRHRGRHLAVRCRGQPKEWTQGNGGTRKKLAVAQRGMTRRAGAARRKGHGRQGQGQEKAV